MPQRVGIARAGFGEKRHLCNRADDLPRGRAVVRLPLHRLNLLGKHVVGKPRRHRHQLVDENRVLRARKRRSECWPFKRPVANLEIRRHIHRLKLRQILRKFVIEPEFAGLHELHHRSHRDHLRARIQIIQIVLGNGSGPRVVAVSGHMAIEHLVPAHDLAVQPVYFITALQRVEIGGQFRKIHSFLQAHHFRCEIIQSRIPYSLCNTSTQLLWFAARISRSLSVGSA